MHSEIDKVRKAAFHFGMAFQIADDLQDLSQDEKNRCQTNVAKMLGREKALAAFLNEMECFDTLLKELNLSTPSFEKMSDLLRKSATSR